MTQLTVGGRASVGGPLAWRAAVLTPARCRLAAALLIPLVAVLHVAYVGAGVTDLAEDEAYYWDWSRQLDYGYFSKGPATAWMVRASCALLGDTALAVRLPAVLLRAGLACCTWWMARRLFGSDRAALAAVALGYLTPIFLTTGLVTTTDPPYLFCWALATCFGCAAVWDRRPWAFVAAGATVGAGALVKPSMPLWLAGLGLFLMADREARPLLRTRGPWLAALAAVPFALPMLIWNARHDWVTFLHVGEDIGVIEGDFAARNVADFFLGQFGVLGPVALLVAPAVIGAAGAAIRGRREGRAAADGPRPETFLLCVGLPVFVGVLVSSLRKHAAANWCAAAYVTFLVLAGRYLCERLDRTRRPRALRIALAAASVAAAGIVLLAHRTELVYPLLARANARLGTRLTARADPTWRVHGWAEVGQRASDLRDALGPGTLVMAQDYMTAAELAFYVRGQPRTFVAGTWFTGPDREPFSQYDLWADRRLDVRENPALRGRRFLYLGKMNDDLRGAFESVRPLGAIDVRRGGIEVRRYDAWACEGFRGMAWPGWEGKYNK